MTSLIMDNAPAKISSFNRKGLHYNLVANAIYKECRRIENPFDKLFLPYIIAGLVSFDMGRMMGSQKYVLAGDAFASRLDSKLQQIRPLLEPLVNLDLTSIDLQKHGDRIQQAYAALSTNGPGALHEDSKKSFHVGATKILHFLIPELSIIVDSNAARAFHEAWELPFRKTAPQGFSAELYLECMKRAQRDINEYGSNSFRALEPNTPITRIYDKLTFVTGSTK